MIDMTRIEEAVNNFKSGYNCSSAVVRAYAEDFGMDKELAVRAMEGFGGGIGRMRKTCGAVSGMVFLAGLKLSSGDACDRENRAKLYATVQDMIHEFESMNGSSECGDLLMGIRVDNSTPEPEERTEGYYKKRPCPRIVEDCARIVEKYLVGI